ncbi:hypothetical protein BDZ45DRAFT_681432 [Acephala macrosclerotiorum]|nr:hypothetical protein BDZ45DRAFT_681432 [Acephala macrosclerotiorum]
MSAPEPNQQQGRGRSRGWRNWRRGNSRGASTPRGSSSAGIGHGGGGLVANEPTQWAQMQWRDTFHNGSYTSLVMLDFLIKKRGVTYDAYLRKRSVILDQNDFTDYEMRLAVDRNADPKPVEFQRTKAWLLQFSDDNFNLVVNNGTGRCTSFAIQTATRLERQHPNIFDFNFYKLGIHHLARCKKTGIVIDSSSKRGAFVLQPGEETTVVSEDFNWQNKWTFIGPESSRFVKVRKDGSRTQITEAPTPITWREAIHNCLIDVACKDAILVFFRSYPQNRNKPTYHAMIKWYVQDKLEIHFMTGPRDENPDRVIFGPGDDETNRECHIFMEVFITLGNNGVRYDGEFAKYAGVVKELWEAGIRVYGKPILNPAIVGTTSGKGSGNMLAGVWSTTSSAAESPPASSSGRSGL